MVALLAGVLLPVIAGAQVKKKGFNISSFLNAYDVNWDTPGPTSMQSMPTGNGDIGLNVWVEASGDLCFFIGKTDAWGAALADEKNNWIKDGGVLMKLGKVRISISPNPLARHGGAFRQILKLHNSEILVKEGTGADAVQLRVWVDANHPVIRVESKSVKPVSVKVTLDNWRLGKGDTVLPKQANEIAWYHQNPDYADRHLHGFVFGGIIKGKGLTSKDDTTLQTIKAVNDLLVSVYPLTTKNLTPDQWRGKLNGEITRIDALPLEQTRLTHQQWWNKFWQRSWIFINYSAILPLAPAEGVTQLNLTAPFSWWIIRNIRQTKKPRRRL
jgi:alpha-L-fucosidase 2